MYDPTINEKLKYINIAEKKFNKKDIVDCYSLSKEAIF
jgi:hypothetical protein